MIIPSDPDVSKIDLRIQKVANSDVNSFHGFTP